MCYVLFIHNAYTKYEHKIFLLVYVRILQETDFNHSDKTLRECNNHMIAFVFTHTSSSLRLPLWYSNLYKNSLNEIDGLID